MISSKPFFSENFRLFIKKNIHSNILKYIQKIIICYRIIFYKTQNFKCIFCKKTVNGYYCGFPPKLELGCPNCFSVGRYRLLGEYLKNKKLSKKNILHFAPEQPIKKMILKKSYKTYIKADYSPKNDEIFCDIENIKFNRNFFDIIICSHVLEHVNYKKAIINLKKILKKNGILLLMFPMIHNWKKTYSNKKILDEYTRTLHFGQFDHLHVFGRDLINRINNLGFQTEEVISFGSSGVSKGIEHGETLFIAKKK